VNHKSTEKGIPNLIGPEPSRYRRKRRSLLRGIIRHELLHIIEPEHNDRFRMLADLVDAPYEFVEPR